MKRYVVETTIYHQIDDVECVFHKWEIDCPPGIERESALKQLVAMGQVTVRQAAANGWPCQYEWPCKSDNERRIKMTMDDGVDATAVLVIQEYPDTDPRFGVRRVSDEC